MKLKFNLYKNEKDDLSLVDHIININHNIYGRNPDQVTENDVQKIFIDLFKICMEEDHENLLESYEKMEDMLVSELSHPDEDKKFISKSFNFDKFRFVNNDFFTNEFSVNKNFVRVFNSLNERTMNRIIDGLSNEASEKMESISDIADKVTQVKAFEKMRSEKGVFRKIADFFTGRMFRERNKINRMKSNIINASEKCGCNKDDVIHALNSKDINAASIIYDGLEPLNMQKVNTTSKRKIKVDELDESLNISTSRKRNNDLEIENIYEKDAPHNEI